MLKAQFYAQNADATNGQLILLVYFLLYFLPTIIAAMRGHINTCALFCLNFFLGWTILGWVGALVWACIRRSNQHTGATPHGKR